VKQNNAGCGEMQRREESSASYFLLKQVEKAVAAALLPHSDIDIYGIYANIKQ
jgi:hypothetical protein